MLATVLWAIPSSGRERDEHVDITVRPEILAHHGPEERQLGHLPSPAEFGDALGRHR
jgi:hypothetical protein